jgi:hypothetical protein
MKVAIIDRGIDPNHRRLKGASISGLTIKNAPDNQTEVIDGQFHDENGHGTAIGAIIFRINPKVEIVSVKLCGKEDVITEDLLAEGIHYCARDKEIRIINISLGSPAKNPSRKLIEACEYARSNHKIIVAACHSFNDKKYYPASFPYVFGVGTGLVESKLDYKYLGEGSVNILAKGTTQRIAWKDNSFKISAGTSYAAAHFSGILSTKMHQFPTPTYDEIVRQLLPDSKDDIEELSYFKDYEREELTENAIPGSNESLDVSFFTPYHDIQFANKVALFPYREKENKTILSNTENPKFDIVAYIDYPRSFSKINGFEVDDSQIKERIIRGSLKDEEFALFDTLVVGYYLEQLFNANVIFGNNLIKKCVSLNKHFIVWDKHVFDYISKIIRRTEGKYCGKVYYPRVDNDLYIRSRKLQYLPRVKTPVIGVIGTSSKQGKVTTQLQLKNILRAEGYKVSHLCTEPQGAMLGAEFSFPFGFKSNVDLPQRHWPEFLDTVMRSIQEANDPHVIISGIQGELIPRHPVNSGGCSFSSLNFITAVNPDAIVCAINPMDTERLIKDTVSTLQKFIHFKFLFFAMTPWYRDFLYVNDNFISKYRTLGEEEYKAKIKEYEKLLDAPVLDIMDARNHAFIVSCIQGAFS